MATSPQAPTRARVHREDRRAVQGVERQDEDAQRGGRAAPRESAATRRAAPAQARADPRARLRAGARQRRGLPGRRPAGRATPPRSSGSASSTTSRPRSCASSRAAAKRGDVDAVQVAVRGAEGPRHACAARRRARTASRSAGARRATRREPGPRGSLLAALLARSPALVGARRRRAGPRRLPRGLAGPATGFEAQRRQSVGRAARRRRVAATEEGLTPCACAPTARSSRRSATAASRSIAVPGGAFTPIQLLRRPDGRLVVRRSRPCEPRLRRPPRCSSPA